MPIYEEKLVSPFAIRFTQDHIRTTFRDGRFVEETIQQITQGAPFGGYDAILRVPFPPIEILRWSVPRQDADIAAEASCPVGVRPREHWFTLDNRRLYCLQRAAVDMWPQRVAAVVAILYADPGTVRKKFDSTSFGWSACIGHSYEELPVARWDWREKVLPLEVSAATDEHGVLEAVLADDRKRTVDALLDAAGALALLYGGRRSCSTPSSPGGSVASDNESRRRVEPRPSDYNGGGGRRSRRRSRQQSEASPSGAAAVAATTLASVPAPDAYDPLVASAVREIKLQITAAGSDGRVNIPGWEERYAKLGPLRRFVESRPDKFSVVPGPGGDFTVTKARKGRAAAAAAVSAGIESTDGPAEVSTDSLTADALADIEEQLDNGKGDGRISIPHWKTRYEPTLGSIRSFVKRWPDRFTVFMSEGRHFRVVRKGDGTSMRAIREIEEQVDHPDSDGTLNFPEWVKRYGEELGTLREFLATCPERFTIVSADDEPEIRVMRTRDALARQAIVEIEAQLAEPENEGRLRLPHWNEVYGNTLGNPRAFLESRPDRFKVTVWEDRRFTVATCRDDMAERALREIEEQLNDSKHDGRTRVPRWKERYLEALGPLRSFLERWPERFKVISGDGTKFMVVRTSDILEVRALHAVDISLGARPEGRVEVPGWAENYESRLGPLTGFLARWPKSFMVLGEDRGQPFVRRILDIPRLTAIVTIDGQIDRAPGGICRLHIEDWDLRFAPTLGPLRPFVENLTGRYTVLPEQGGNFSIRMVSKEVVFAAVSEVAAQFREPGYDGFVSFPDWGERYAPYLGTLRQFLASHPERFRVTYIGNTMYAYPAAVT